MTALLLVLLGLLDGAETSFERRDYREASRQLRRAKELLGAEGAPARWRARVATGLGTIALVEGRLGEAERRLREAEQLIAAEDSDLAAVLHNLASVQAQSGRLPEALRHQRRAIAIWEKSRNPQRAKAWTSLGTMEAMAGDWKTAARSLERGLAIEESAETWGNYALVLERLGRGKEARAIQRKLSRSESTSTSPSVDARALIKPARAEARAQ